jgi:Protein of unknwon function (DUF3310)
MQNMPIQEGKPPEADSAIRPAHYRGLSPEPIEIIERWGLGFHLGNAVKYIARAGRKTPDAYDDLRKAIWYIERECYRLEREKA